MLLDCHYIRPVGMVCVEVDYHMPVSREYDIIFDIHGTFQYLQVVCVLMSIGGVTLVSLFSNKTCKISTPGTNNTDFVNASYMPDHNMVSHLNPHGGSCSSEKSTPGGYIVSPLLFLLTLFTL